jgi:hypothetical protein
VWGLEGGAGDPAATGRWLSDYLEREVLARGRRVLLDSFQMGPAIGAQVRPSHQRLLIMGFDRRFHAAISRPAEYHIGYVFVPRPQDAPQDAILRARPRLWTGREPGFQLVKTFHGPRGMEWRLFAVRPGVRPLGAETGGVR